MEAGPHQSRPSRKAGGVLQAERTEPLKRDEFGVHPLEYLLLGVAYPLVLIVTILLQRWLA